MRRTRRIAILSSLFGIAILSSLLWIGCNRASKTEDPAGNSDAADGPASWTDASVKPSGSPWAGSLQVSVGDWKAFQKVVESHKGTVVVAGFWASWSDKIVPQIRQLARLQNKFPGKIIVLQVSVDHGEDPATRPDVMRPKLEKLVREWVGPELPNDATVQLFISNQVDEEFYEHSAAIEAVPTVFVYDQSGQRTKIFLGGEKVIDGRVHVVPLVEKLLKK